MIRDDGQFVLKIGESFKLGFWSAGSRKNEDSFLYSLSNRLIWIVQVSIRNQQGIQTDNRFHIIRISYNMILRSKYEKFKNEFLMFINTSA